MKDATEVRRDPKDDTWLAGIDGCRDGWIAVFVQPEGDNAHAKILRHFSEVSADMPAVITVDMPIGLPERTGYGGREAENCVRPLLGARQSSVFSVPSRSAVYADDYAQACACALATSDPSRKVSKQLFNICTKIREVDAALRADATLASRTFEVHPEVAFWRLNGEKPLGEPKKIKSKPYDPGLALRRGLLLAAGLPRKIVESAPPKGAAVDDLLDALACAAIARRIHAGLAEPFPKSAPRDAYGLPMAIWA
jgi:predicted RNase H-like nuclease